MKTQFFTLNRFIYKLHKANCPELKRVIVAAGDKVTMSPSIDEGIQLITKQQFKPIYKTNSLPLKKENNLTKKIIDAYSKAKESLKTSTG